MRLLTQLVSCIQSGNGKRSPELAAALSSLPETEQENFLLKLVVYQMFMELFSDLCYNNPVTLYLIFCEVETLWKQNRYWITAFPP